MIVSKHISLDKDYIDKIQSCVERHDGNFSSAIREIIDNAERSGIPNNASVVDTPLLDWILEDIDGRLIPDNILDEIINPGLIYSMKNFENYISRRFKELEWGIDISLKYDLSDNPSNIFIEIKGYHQQKIRFVSRLISQYLVKNSLERNPLAIAKINSCNNCINIDLYRSDKKRAINSIITFFGDMDDITGAIKNRPDFWKSLIHRHIISNYNMITVHRNYFEDILLGKTPMGEIMIESIAKRPISEININDMLLLIKQVYETSRVADRVDINCETITIFHSFRDIQAVEKIKKSLIMLLEASGHLYDAKITSNTIMLKHRPDIGIKINEIVDNLKTSNSSVDQQLIMFMTFIKGLKEIPDIPLYLTSLGRRIGKSLLQEYEKENNIKVWDLENFKKALEMINIKIHMDSELECEKNNLLYRIKRCSLATEGKTLDNCVCHTSREVFKGALSYAFGNRAELEVKKLLSHGDNYCEVVIRIRDVAR